LTGDLFWINLRKRDGHIHASDATMSTKAVRTNDPTSETSVARVDTKFDFGIPVSDRAKEFSGRRCTRGWRRRINPSEKI
jgi:hypothetical protein